MLQHSPSHQGKILKLDYLEPLEISITTAAEGLGIARKNLSAIINEKAIVSPEMAIRLSEAFNPTPDFWLNLQTNYDLWKARNAPARRRIKRFYTSKKIIAYPEAIMNLLMARHWVLTAHYMIRAIKQHDTPCTHPDQREKVVPISHPFQK